MDEKRIEDVEMRLDAVENLVCAMRVDALDASNARLREQLRECRDKFEKIRLYSAERGIREICKIQEAEITAALEPEQGKG